MLTVHVHVNGGGDWPRQVRVGGCTGELGVEEGPVDGVEADLVPDGAVAQDLVAVVNYTATS